MRQAFGRLSGFSVAVLLPAAVGLLVIPILIRIGGQDAWSAIAVGQSAGTIAGILVALGWGFNGPTLVAMAPADERHAIAMNSLLARIVFAPLIIGVACVVAALLRPDAMVISAGSALATGILGLGMTWLFIGAGDVTSLLLLDAVPRVLASVVGIGMLLAWRDASWFVFCQLVGAIVSVLASAHRSTRGRPSNAQWGLGIALAQTRKQVFAGITVITAATYLSMPTLIVAALSPASVFVYAIADRLTRFTFLGIGPLYQWMQGWVPSHTIDGTTVQRIRKVSRISAVVALVLAAAIVVLGPTAARVLGDQEGLLTWTLTVPLGISVAMSALSRCSGMVCLLALGKDRDVAVSAVMGACFGVPLLLVLVPTFGAVGAAVAVMISETVVAGYQWYRLRTSVHEVGRSVRTDVVRSDA